MCVSQFCNSFSAVTVCQIVGKVKTLSSCYCSYEQFGIQTRLRGLFAFGRHNIWLIKACKMYSNQTILSLKTENTRIEQDLRFQSKRSGEENKVNVFMLLIKEQVHHDFSGVYLIT